MFSLLNLETPWIRQLRNNFCCFSFVLVGSGCPFLYITEDTRLPLEVSLIKSFGMAMKAVIARVFPAVHWLFLYLKS